MLNPLDVKMPPPEVPLPPHTLLPHKTQEHLKHAAAFENEALRTQAVDGAIAAAKQHHPHLFRSKL